MKIVFIYEPKINLMKVIFVYGPYESIHLRKITFKGSIEDPWRFFTPRPAHVLVLVLVDVSSGSIRFFTITVDWVNNDKAPIIKTAPSNCPREVEGAVVLLSITCISRLCSRVLTHFSTGVKIVTPEDSIYKCYFMAFFVVYVWKFNCSLR